MNIFIIAPRDVVVWISSLISVISGSEEGRTTSSDLSMGLHDGNVNADSR